MKISGNKVGQARTGGHRGAKPGSPPQAVSGGSAENDIYRLLFELSPDAIAVHNGKKLLMVNPAAARLLGASAPDELIGKPVMKFIHPGDRPAARSRFASQLNGVEVATVQEKLTRLDGSSLDVEVASAPCRLNDAPATLVLARDVTARHRTEQELRLFRSLLDHSSDAIQVIDPASGAFLDVNETECGSLGYSRGELLSMKIFDIDPGLRPIEFKRVIARLRKQEALTFEATHRKKDGTLFPVEVSARLVRLEREYVLSVARDISARKQAEETQLRINLRFRAMIEHSWDGLTLVDREGKVLYSSPANARIVGYSEQEREGRSAVELIHPEDRGLVAGFLGEVAAQPGGVRLIAYRVATRDGQQKWIESIAHNLLDEPGVEAIVVNFRDITARKQSEEQLRLQKALLESASEASLDGIAIISPQREWLHYNQRFIEMWNIPPEVAAEGKSRRIVEFTRRQVVNPREFRANIEYLYENMDVSQQDEVHLKDGRIFDRYTGPVWAADGSIYGRIWYCRDITERKQVEQALKASEARWRAIFDHAGVGIALVDRDGHPVQNNLALQQMLGYTGLELSGMSFAEFTHPDDVSKDLGLAAELAVGKRDKYQMEKRYIRKDGQTIWVNLTATALRDETGRMQIGLGMAEDITQRKQAEEALRANEAWFRALIENSRDMVRVLDEEGRTLYVSPSAERIMGFPANESIGTSIFELIHPEDLERARSAWQRILNSHGPVAGSIEARIRHADGSWHVHEAIGANLLDNPDVGGFVMNSRDISDRKHAEAQLRESELRFRTLIEQAPVAIVFTRAGNVTYANPRFLQIFGVDGLDRATGKPALEFFAPQARAESLERTRLRSLGQPVPEAFESVALRSDGSQFAMQIAVQQVELPDGPVNISFVTDISERKRSEETLRESEERFRILSQAAFEGILIHENGIIQDANQIFAELIGMRNPDELVGKNGMEFLPFTPESIRELRAHLSADGITGPLEITVIRPDGSSYPAETQGRGITLRGKRMRVVAMRDISVRKQAEEKIQRQLERLTALGEIDRSITSSFDLRQSLETLLTHVGRQLNVDAADVLLYDPGAQMLEYTAGLGFRTGKPNNTPIQIGEGHAGRVIRERRMLMFPDLREQPRDPIRNGFFVAETFVSYCAVPLIAKGQVRGVLEIFQRRPLEPDKDWIDFLHALAEQGAIAIENATLFNNLQRSNSELSLAYDATIEGWSRALDLRDRETEGHTLRVTDLTVQLGRAFRLSESELIQIRWGALLHDIGKMGVPDGILFKPGPLGAEEWAIMRKHPVFAYEMLAPIRYLRAALDIPYLHHEKWDGTGYPLGLKGEQIPLAARIFAVADVWDALRSDRPYRPAWSVQQAREHIASLAGTHFDPRVVDVFLAMRLE